MEKDLNNKYPRILITGGLGFIGGTLLRRLIQKTNCKIFNIDNMGYSSDLHNIKETLSANKLKLKNYKHINIDIKDKKSVFDCINESKPNLIFHLAAESHVDRSIEAPAKFIESNIIGTYNLLESARNYWNKLLGDKHKNFKIIHISTDEVYGSLGPKGKFNEKTSYDPRSPYSASKASSNHLVNSWNHTYGLPTIITNCSNNYGPWQFPEKLIPVVLLKAIKGESIPLYGDGKNIRDWLYVEDHIDALLLTAIKGVSGETYCIGGKSERTNKEVVELICNILDKELPHSRPYSNLIKFVKDRPGHDRRYAINPSKIINELGWKANHKFEEGMHKTINWYIKNIKWIEYINNRSDEVGKRIGLKY